MEELKAFKDLSKAEQGVILLAIHNGERVEIKPNASAEWMELIKLYPASSLAPKAIVRIKPIPRVIHINMDTGTIYTTRDSHGHRVKFIECMEGE